jgi:hypothetical protein
VRAQLEGSDVRGLIIIRETGKLYINCTNTFTFVSRNDRVSERQSTPGPVRRTNNDKTNEVYNEK